MSSADDRRLGALYGLAIGDALGMPTQESVAAAFEASRCIPMTRGKPA